MILLRYLLLGTGIGLLLASFLLFLVDTPPQIEEREEGSMAVRVVLLGAQEEREELHWIATPQLLMPPVVEKEEVHGEIDLHREDGEEMKWATEQEIEIGEVEEIREEEEIEEVEEIEEGEEIDDREEIHAPVMEGEERTTVNIFLPYTTPASGVIQILYQAGLIEDEDAFLEELISKDALYTLQAGEHPIPMGSSHGEIIHILLGRRGDGD